jgi:GT2 family glycosyltransferase
MNDKPLVSVIVRAKGLAGGDAGLNEGEELHNGLEALTGTSETVALKDALLQKDAVIENLKLIIKEKDERISTLRTDHFLVIESLGWQILEGIRRFLELLFPYGSRRRESFVRAKKYFKYLVRHGAVRNFARTLLRRNKTPDAAFRHWITKNEPDAAELARQSEAARQAEAARRWQTEAASGARGANPLISVVTVFYEPGGGIKCSPALDEAGQNPQADYIAFLRNTDTLAPFALFEIARAINENPGCDFLYCDTDVISKDGKTRHSPAFKPDWSPDALRSADYVSDFMIIGRALFDECGGLQTDARADCGEAFAYDLALRATEKAGRIVHIPKILCHISETNARHDANKTEGALKALGAHLARLGMDGDAQAVSDGVFKITYKLTRSPLVSIVIPNRNSAKELRVCLESVYKKSSYKNFEVVVVENGSSDEEIFRLYEEYEKLRSFKLARWSGPFNFSDVNNYGVGQSAGDVLLFLNNDTEAINPDWLERMLEHAQRREVGAVGAKLYYPNDTIQHAGVVVGLGGIAGHSHKGFKRTSAGYTNRLLMVQNYSAVTAACMMMRREVFQEAEGFDPGYPLAYNDVDLCMKLIRQGYLIVWTPWAELYHYESMTRGIADTPDKLRKFFAEMQRFRSKWSGYVKKGDPFYSPNLTLHREDFSIKIYRDDAPDDASAYLFD